MDDDRSLLDGVWSGTRRATRHLLAAGIEVWRAAAVFVEEVRGGGDEDEAGPAVEWIPLEDDTEEA